MRPNSVPAGHRQGAVLRNPLIVTVSSEGLPVESSASEPWPGTTLIEAIRLLTRADHPEPMMEAIELLTRSESTEPRGTDPDGSSPGDGHGS
jgi:hypothetical protein